MLYTNKVDSFSVTANLISPACIVSLKDYLCQHFLQHFLPVNVTNMYDPWFLQQWTIPPVVLCLVLQELPGHRGFRWLVFFSTSGCWILGFWSLALAVAMLSCLPPVPPPRPTVLHLVSSRSLSGPFSVLSQTAAEECQFLYLCLTLIPLCSHPWCLP